MLRALSIILMNRTDLDEFFNNLITYTNKNLMKAL